MAGVVVCHKCRARNRIANLGGGPTEDGGQRKKLKIHRDKRVGKLKLPEDRTRGRNPN